MLGYTGTVQAFWSSLSTFSKTNYVLGSLQYVYFHCFGKDILLTKGLITLSHLHKALMPNINPPNINYGLMEDYDGIWWA